MVVRRWVFQENIFAQAIRGPRLWIIEGTARTVFSKPVWKIRKVDQHGNPSKKSWYIVAVTDERGTGVTEKFREWSFRKVTNFGGREIYYSDKMTEPAIRKCKHTHQLDWLYTKRQLKHYGLGGVAAELSDVQIKQGEAFQD